MTAAEEAANRQEEEWRTEAKTRLATARNG